MVVGFATTYAISACHHWWCESESRSRRGVQHCVIKFVSHLRQVGGFHRVLRFPPSIKLTSSSSSSSSSNRVQSSNWVLLSHYCPYWSIYTTNDERFVFMEWYFNKKWLCFIFSIYQFTNIVRFNSNKNSSIAIPSIFPVYVVTFGENFRALHSQVSVPISIFGFGVKYICKLQSSSFLFLILWKLTDLCISGFVVVVPICSVRFNRRWRERR